MRRLAICVLAFACIFGCAKVEEIHKPSVGLRAKIAKDAAATRSIVLDNPGASMESFWVGGDMIGVFGAGAHNLSFSLEESDISEGGKQALFTARDIAPEGELIAYYPYSLETGSSGNLLKLKFPAVQRFVLSDGTPVPDPSACVMMGKGNKDEGLEFRNVMAVVKVGELFESACVVESVVFHDLSGSAVSGNYSLEWKDGAPVAHFSDASGDISLVIDGGLELQAGAWQSFCIVVPPREYPEGFEISFNLADGTKIVRKAGTKMGKSLSRSVVYQVGAFTSPGEIAEGMSYTLSEKAQVMTPEVLDMVELVEQGRYYVRDEDGNLLKDSEGIEIMMPTMTLLVHKDAKPSVGGWMMFNQPSADLPYGGVFKVADVWEESGGEFFRVNLVHEANFAAPFKELTLGEASFDSEGTFSGEGAVELDIAPYLKSVQLSYDESSGEVEELEVSSVLSDWGKTKASAFSKSFTTPKFNLQLEKSGKYRVNLGASFSMKVKMAAGVIDGEVQYYYLRFDPSTDFEAAFSVFKKIELASARKNLYTFNFLGIPVGPIVIVPELGFSAIAEVAGELTLDTSLKFHHDYGYVSLGYNKGDGFSCRPKLTLPSMPQLSQPSVGAAASGSVSASAGIGIRAGASVYGLFSLGANMDIKAKASTGIGYDFAGRAEPLCFKIGPELELKPYTAALGGRFTKVFDGFSVSPEMSTWYERYISPVVVTASVTASGPWVDPKEMHQHVGYNYRHQSFDTIEYNIELEKQLISDYDVEIDVYQGTMASVPDMGSSTGYSYVLKDAIVIHSYRVGSYSRTADSFQASGSIPYYFAPGSAFGIGIALERGSERIVIESPYRSPFVVKLIDEDEEEGML